MKENENDPFYGEAHNWSRHYDSTLWTVTSIFIAANSGLLAYAYTNKQLDWKLSIIGVFLTWISFFFAASFRSLRRKLNDYLDDNDRKKDIPYLRSQSAVFRQWPIYLLVHSVFLVFWFDILAKKKMILLWWVLLALSIIILIFFYCASDKIKISVKTNNKNNEKKWWEIIIELLIVLLIVQALILLIVQNNDIGDSGKNGSKQFDHASKCQ
jgi:hypothetical protein